MAISADLSLLFISIGLIIAVFTAVWLWLRMRPHKAYVCQKQLFSAAEWRFLAVLERLVGRSVRVFGQVRVADVLAVRTQLPRKQRWRAFTQISSKHFDYVLVDAKTGVIKAVIELNDRSHHRVARKRRDAFLRSACKQAGLPLLEVPVQAHYDEQQLRSDLQALLK